MEMGERREGEIDLESVEDDHESEERNGELEWEYEYDLGMMGRRRERGLEVKSLLGILPIVHR
jgi:hypothetical protein